MVCEHVARGERITEREGDELMSSKQYEVAFISFYSPYAANARGVVDRPENVTERQLEALERFLDKVKKLRDNSDLI